MVQVPVMIPQIAIGAIVAAIVGAMISLVGLIVVKESKVSEFRQNWIDSLRSELAAFASHLNALSDGNHVEFDSVKDKFDSLSEHTTKLNEAYYCVAFRLNTEESQSILVRSSMVKLMKLVSSSGVANAGEFESLQISFIRDSNALLKNEWKRVKSGEKVYRATLKVAVFILVILFSSVAAILVVNATSDTKKSADGSPQHFISTQGSEPVRLTPTPTPTPTSASNVIAIQAGSAASTPVPAPHRHQSEAIAAPARQRQ